MTIGQLYSLYLQYPLICTDTRNILPGSIFFALKGDHFDANTFAGKAVEAGAAYAVIDDRACQEDERFLLVDNVLTTLQDLARHHRSQLDIPVIGLTGTNGKTTTKELMKAVLSQRFNTLATSGNLNNHIGVPLTLLSITANTELAIIEMGANHQQEIAFLSQMVQPDYGLITNIGKAHLEGFGSEEGIKKGKGELYDYLRDTRKTAFINRDNAVLMTMATERKLKNSIGYGKGKDCLVDGRLTENAPFLKLTWWQPQSETKTYQVQTALTGAYNFENMMAAICAGIYFGLSPDQINKALSAYQPNNNRSQITKTVYNTLICDYYNANPSSMRAALSNLDDLQADEKVMILGDMFELGNESGREHELIIQKANVTPVKSRIFIGEAFFQFSGFYDGEFFITTEEALTYLKKHPVKNATVLLKGSRGMALEQLLACL